MTRQDRHRGSRSGGGAGAWVAPVLGVLVAGGLIAFVGHSMLQHDRVAAQKALDKASIRHAVEAAHGDYAAALAHDRDAQGKVQAIAAISVPAAAAGDRGAQLRRFLDGMLNRFIALRNDFLAETRDTGWDKVGDPDRIGADAGMKQSLAMVASMTAILTKYRDRSHAAIADIRHEIPALPFTEAERQQILGEYDAELNRMGAQLDATWEMQGKVVKDVGDLFELLHRRRGQWRVVQHKFVFNNAKGLSEFQTYALALQDITQQAQMMQMQDDAAGGR